MGLSKTVDCPRAYTYSNVSFCIRYSKRFRKRFRKRLCAKTHNERPILKIMNNVLIWGFLNLIRYEECPLYVNKSGLSQSNNVRQPLYNFTSSWQKSGLVQIEYRTRNIE